MGDKSNIVIQESKGNRIYLYGHWMGASAIEIVAEVLSQRERWNDEPYLARMLFAKMTEASPKDSSTGYGISTYMCDTEYPLIVLEPATQTAVLEEYAWGDGSFNPITPRVSFEQLLESASLSNTYEELAMSLGAKYATTGT